MDILRLNGQGIMKFRSCYSKEYVETRSSMKYFWLSLTLVLTTALTSYSQTATFSGRVTDQNTGVGISNVAVVAVGNQTGTRVSITDTQGNYMISMGANNNI